MRLATEFQELKNDYETTIAERIKLMSEEELVFNNKLPNYSDGDETSSYEEASLNGSTTSIYLAPNYSVAIARFGEYTLQQFPTLQYESSKKIFKNEDSSSLNTVVRTVMSVNKLNYKLNAVMSEGLRKGFCVCEVVPTFKRQKGEKLTRDENGKEDWEPFDNKIYGLIDIIRYNPKTTYIDPNADPIDIANTAAFVIVKVGTYTLSRFKEIAKEKGWSIGKETQEQYLNTGYSLDDETAKFLEGVDSQKGVTVHKLFKSDGTVQTIANSTYIIHEGINSKRMYRMPLIFYTSIAGGSTPYGKMLWADMKQSVLCLSACLNLALDNIGKNMKSPIFTSLADLNGTNINEMQKDGIVHVTSMDSARPLKDSFHKLEVPDMTAGLQAAINIFSQHANEVSRQDSLSTGAPQHQVRTNAIAETMTSGNRDKKSNIIKQAEYTLIDHFGEHLIWILATHYPDFEEVQGISRDKLFDIKSVRTRNGSTLEEDNMTQLQRITQLLQIVLQLGDDSYDTEKIVDVIADLMGVTDFEGFKLPAQEMIMKARLKAGGIPPEQVQQ